ncbi:MAG TPA: NADPH-dependent FMN reductase [Gammaproteobacteria bacterium]
MATIIGISGSLRQQSFNSALLNAAVSLAPSGMHIQTRSITEVPLYNYDIEKAQGVPEPVEQLKRAIAAADGLLICTPEYNNSMPGVLKNVIDWLSRPPDDIQRVFGGLPVGIMGASPGRFGTLLSQNAWLPVMRTLGTRLWSGGRLMVTGASKVFDDEGAIVDEGTRERLQKFLDGFAAFIESNHR